MTRIRSSFCGLAITVALGNAISCSNLNSGSKSMYALDPGRPAAPGDAAPAQAASSAFARISRDQILQVRRVAIAPPFDGPSLIYRSADGTYVKDYYNEWVAAPEELLSTEMVDWLSTLAPFPSVVDGRSGAPHRFALETSITSLYGDFQDPRKPAVALSARVYLLDESAGNRTIAYQNHYEISVPIASASAPQLVSGSDRAYRRFLESVTRDLVTFHETTVAADTR